MLKSVPLCDLHIHLGASVAPHIMWSIAHSQGFKLPVKDYWEFKDMVTVDPKKCKGLDDYLKILHEWTERIQSSPAAVERSVYEIIGKEYRGSRVEQIELRFNPMKRNLSAYYRATENLLNLSESNSAIVKVLPKIIDK